MKCIRPVAPGRESARSTVVLAHAIVLASPLAFAAAAQATALVWVPTTGGSFNDPANWSPVGGPPGTNAADTATFNNNAVGTITFSNGVTFTTQSFKNTSAASDLDLNATGFVQTVTGNFIVGGAAGERNNVSLVGGEFKAAIFLIGNNATSNNNILTVTGSSTKLTTTSASAGLRVGSSGGSDNIVSIEDGADASVNNQIIVGLGAGASNNLLRVTGPGSTLSTVVTASLVNIGSTGSSNSRVEVLDGGEFNSGSLLLGVGGTGNFLQISGNGATYTAAGGTTSGITVEVGRAFANNTTRIETGGALSVTAGDVVIGRDAGSTGNLLHVDGGELTLHGSGDLDPSLIGTGRVDVRRGTLRVSSGTAIVPGLIANTGASSVLDLQGGTLAVAQAAVASGSVFSIGNGTGARATYEMTRAAGTHTFGNGVSIASDGTLSGSGTIVGAVAASGTGAEADIGGSIGQINVTGDWSNVNLSLLLEVGDNSAGVAAGITYDYLGITGTFTHGGLVQIDVSDLVAPAAETEAKLIGWTADSGLSGSTSVFFVGGDPLAYEFRADGLYVTLPVPEPALASSVALCASALLSGRRRRTRS